MYIYKVIIWLSLLALIGEGVVLSGLNFIPHNGARGAVLGESTAQVLEELAYQRFPASYYSDIASDTDDAGETAEQTSANATEQEDAKADAPESANEQSYQPVAPVPADTFSDPRDAFLKILNTPSQYEVSFPPVARQKPAGDTGVDTLIKKNERLYRERIIKELNGIKERLENIGAGA